MSDFTDNDAKDPYCKRYASYMKSIYCNIPVYIRTRFNDLTNDMMKDSYISKQKLWVAIGNYEDIFGAETNQNWKLFKHTAYTYDPYIWKDSFKSYQYQYKSNNFSEESKQVLEIVEPDNRLNNGHLPLNVYSLRMSRPTDASINVHALRTLTGNEMLIGRILTGPRGNAAIDQNTN